MTTPHANRRLHLFEGFGVELEYMIVDRGSLDIRPFADRVLLDEDGKHVSDLEFGPIAWSNELARHVIEIKTNGPTSNLADLANQFQENVQRINELLIQHDARLMPGGMHPWMNPSTDFQLWPHDFREVYAAYHRIFNCQGHGWANLQSVHLNLPFANDDEFGRLHAAVRLLLPILPGLAASSPIVNGRISGPLDTRLDVYRNNAKRIPSIIGRVIPEPVFNEADYLEQILEPMYRDIAAFDPEGLLQEEFLNSRGAIARFGRGSLEIRVLDVQECPQADVAICALVVEVLQLLVNERWVSLVDQQAWPTEPLEAVFLSAIRDGHNAKIESSDYLAVFGLRELGACTIQQVWQHLLSEAGKNSPEFLERHGQPLSHLILKGPLAARLLGAMAREDRPERLQEVYGELCHCLAENRLFGVEI